MTRLTQFCRTLCLAGPLLSGWLPTQAQNNLVLTSPASSGPGTQNTLVGIGAGNTSMAGTYNIFVGYQAGNVNTTGGSNVFMGFGAGYSNTAGFANAFIWPYTGVGEVYWLIRL